MTPTADPDVRTLGDVLRDLGGVPADRVVWLGRPATERDLLRTRGTELIDGWLVYKSLGCRKALAESALASWLMPYVRPRALGAITAGSGPYRVTPGVVRRLDLAFITWPRLCEPGQPLPDVAPVAPDLVADFSTDVNTPAETARKRRELFAGGTRLFWSIDPDARTVAAFTDPDTHTVLSAADTLSGDPVLPGFVLPLADLFDDPQLNPRPPRTA